MTQTDSLLQGLPVLQRLALSYAPRSAAPPTLALLALDARMAGIVRTASEPLLAQLRLAWWREQLEKSETERPGGEPLLAALEDWRGGKQALVDLANGWEEMTGEAPLTTAAFERLADARGKAFAALAERIGAPDSHGTARRLGRNWALADIAAHLGHPEEQRIARDLAQRQDWRTARLSRKMRPLAVLHGLAARATRRGEGLEERSPTAMLAAIRLGFLGR